jgi:hypothetical protein
VIGIPCRHAAVTAWHKFPCAVQLHPNHLIMPVCGLRLAWLGAVVCARTPRVQRVPFLACVRARTAFQYAIYSSHLKSVEQERCGKPDL